MATPKYRIHRFDTGVSVKKEPLEQMLNGIEGEVVAIVPNVIQFPFARINYLLIVEKASSSADR